jgi:N-acetylneuraminic acid mutarotase
LDGETQDDWRKLSKVQGTIPKNRHLFTAITYENYIYIFGGNKETSDLLRFDMKLEKWEPLLSTGKSSPGCRGGHTAVLYHDFMYIFGGYHQYQDLYYNDMWCLCLQSLKWCKMKQIGDIPDSRDGHTAVVIHGKQYVFGGYTKWKGYVNSLFVYDFSNNTWRKIIRKISPLPRARHTAIVYEGCVIVFGGYNGRSDTYYNDLWSFDPRSEMWTQFEVPDSVPKMFGHTAILYKHEMIVFGGTTPKGVQNWLWKYDLFTKQFSLYEQHNTIPHRKSHVATLYRGSMIVMGGEFESKNSTKMMEVYILPLESPIGLPVVNNLKKQNLIDIIFIVE